MPTQRMRVQKYIPDKLYGFASPDGGSDVFFHLGAFRPGGEVPPPTACTSCGSPCSEDAKLPPPPILGEEVEVTYEVSEGDKAPRATLVERLTAPTPLHGRVGSMDPHRGFGFLEGEDGETYHLHRCEVVDGRLPLPGQQVLFYPGTRQERPRACHVRVCRWRRTRTC